ncbi:ribosomal protein S18-alanine N-acetyltransferase [Faecalispora anaeroviscerum]|uniref:ribosomal protein S18-alanine N-acetyltransferase n=1 Tax=Faecalispora anaeroviscerum TaxID=2991836 RepID=UPI0024BB5CEE|nr:ribosomal protein S18-alanine N-acetyltransferase [Faecalispora anaeroviscerum]
MEQDKTVEIHIVPMQEQHLDALAELEQLCFSQPWSREGLATELLEPTACFLAAECGGKTIGYAGMHCVLEEAYVTNVAVDPRFRRHGAGRLLMQALERAAVERGAASLSLEVRLSNQGAIDLYRGCGFEEIGLRRGLYEQPKEDGLILTKTFC